MAEMDALARIQTAFAPYSRSPEQLLDIRVQIAKYIASLQPAEHQDSQQIESFSIPQHVTGIRRHYLKSCNANVEAKREYSQLRKEVQTRASSLTAGDASHRINAIESHLRLLHLRRQYQKCQILNHYASEIENLTSKSQLFDPQPPTFDLNDVGPTDTTLTDLSPLLLEAKDLTHNLQVAVLQANHKLEREKQLLNDVKNSIDIPPNPSAEARLRALTATNQELTRWIEESLAKCDAASGNASSQAAHATVSRLEYDINDYDSAINEQYGQYLEARQRLLEAAAELTSPLPDTSSNEVSTGNPVSQLVKDSQPLSLSTHDCSIATLMHLDIDHMPLQNHQETLQQTQTHIDLLFSTHMQDLSERLSRLGDESHLLPSYPILAKAKKEPAHLNEAERLVGAWRFAMDAAGTATEAMVERQVKIGERAIAETNVVLRGLEEEQQLWGRLDEAEKRA